MRVKGRPRLARPAFSTGRLLLRPLLPSDADDLAELDADPEVHRYVHLDGPPTRSDLEAALPKMLSRFGPSATEPAVWAAEERSSGRFIGWFHLRPSELPDSYDLGYRLRRDTWGQGYGSEGASALVERAFQHLEARRVEATALAANAASIRVMEKAGLRFLEGFMWEGAHPAVRYAYDRSEWSGKR